MRKQPIVFDIDGTLTSEHCDEDGLLSVKENPEILSIALTLQDALSLVISTARPERYRSQTEQWLRSHGLIYRALYMRPNDSDRVLDQVVKEAHLKDIRLVFGEPVVWFDDNPSNIKMLVKNGVRTIHVKQP